MSETIIWMHKAFPMRKAVEFSPTWTLDCNFSSRGYISVRCDLCPTWVRTWCSYYSSATFVHDFYNLFQPARLGIFSGHFSFEPRPLSLRSARPSSSSRRSQIRCRRGPGFEATGRLSNFCPAIDRFFHNGCKLSQQPTDASGRERDRSILCTL